MSIVTNRFNLQWPKALNYKKNETGVKNKLRIYNTFKSTFEYENYLDYGSDFRQRKIVTKLRISAHSFEIEVGRHKTKNGPKKTHQKNAYVIFAKQQRMNSIL